MRKLMSQIYRFVPLNKFQIPEDKSEITNYAS
jgi:hypothetical protein